MSALHLLPLLVVVIWSLLAQLTVAGDSPVVISRGTITASTSSTSDTLPTTSSSSQCDTITGTSIAASPSISTLEPVESALSSTMEFAVRVRDVKYDRGGCLRVSVHADSPTTWSRMADPPDPDMIQVKEIKDILAEAEAHKEDGKPFPPEEVTFHFSGLDRSVKEIAVMAHHDLSGDGKVAKNWIGIPTDGLGASRGAKGGPLGGPKWEKACINLPTGDAAGGGSGGSGDGDGEVTPAKGDGGEGEASITRPTDAAVQVPLVIDISVWYLKKN